MKPASATFGPLSGNHMDGHTEENIVKDYWDPELLHVKPCPLRFYHKRSRVLEESLSKDCLIL